LKTQPFKLSLLRRDKIEGFRDVDLIKITFRDENGALNHPVNWARRSIMPYLKPMS
jgi:hypothetical protein